MAENDILENDNPVWTLGDRLAKARRSAGLQQADMAKEFGVSRAAIGTWERDEVEPRHLLAVIQRWSELTRTSTWWLLGIEALSNRCLEEVA